MGDADTGVGARLRGSWTSGSGTSFQGFGVQDGNCVNTLVGNAGLNSMRTLAAAIADPSGGDRGLREFQGPSSEEADWIPQS